MMMNVKVKTEPLPTIPTPTIPMTLPLTLKPEIPTTPKIPTTTTLPMTVPTPVIPMVVPVKMNVPKSYAPGTYFSRTKFGFMKRMKREFDEEKIREYWYNNLRENNSDGSTSKMRSDALKPLKHSFLIRNEMGTKRNVIERVQGRILSFKLGGRIKNDPTFSKKENLMKKVGARPYKPRGPYKKRGKYKQRVSKKIKIPANINIIGDRKKSNELVRKRGRPRRENYVSKGSTVFDNPEIARRTIKKAVKMGYHGSYMDVRDGNLLMNLRKPGSKVEIDPISRRRNLMNPDRGHVTEPGLCNYYSRMKPRTSSQVSDNLLLLAFTSVDD